jgi:hypothetical protein
LAENEAKALAHAIKEAERHFPMPIRKDHAALGALATTCFAVYGGKIKAIRARKAAEKRAAGSSPPPGNANPAPFDIPVPSGVSAAPADPVASWWQPPGGPPN